jgi:hypothetical protein
MGHALAPVRLRAASRFDSNSTSDLECYPSQDFRIAGNCRAQ